jgi:hypothetical protein
MRTTPVGTGKTGFYALVTSKDTQAYEAVGDAVLSTAPVSFAAEQAKLNQYNSDRDAMVKAAFGDDPPSMVAVAMPVDKFGRTPFITADQQRLIDSVTDQYIGQDNIAGLMDKLTRLGVNPDQIADNAQYFIGKGGQVTDRFGNVVSGALLDIMT